MRKKEKLNEIYSKRYLYGKIDVIQLSDRMVRKYIEFNIPDVSPYERTPAVIMAVGDYDLSIRVKIYHYLHENFTEAYAMGGLKYRTKDAFILSKDFSDYMEPYL